MKISIITAVFNSQSTINDCLKSIATQRYNNIEHIIIDGGSTDGTFKTIQNFISAKRSEDGPVPAKRSGDGSTFNTQHSQLLSEPDSGIYDALNKGIKLASGDIIGLLHADDIYSDENVLSKVAQKFETEKTDSVYGDLVYVDKKDLRKVMRYWKAGSFNYGSLLKGWMPPHPAFFVKREIYTKFGLFDTDLKIAADYDLILRFLGTHKISTSYLPEVLVKMRWGGKSNKSIANIFQKSHEDYRALKKNNFPNAASILFRKNFSKLSQFFKPPNI